jgi:hypothetical protein
MELPVRTLRPLCVIATALVSALALPPPAAAQAAPDPKQPARLRPMAPEKRTLYLSAFFSEKGEQVRSGVKWRVFRARTDTGGQMPIVVESNAAAPVFALEPGLYVVNAAYGLAAAARRVEIGDTTAVEKVVLNAGGLKVEATIKDQPVPLNMLTSRIHAILPSGERRLIAENVPADNVIRLPEGRYFVESTYGDSNATVSAEIAIKAGQLTDATFHHNAATLTLKLVNQAGGEALADTSWSILTPGGDVIRESIGAFPSVILAEGNYTVVARHDGRVYTREFDVQSGFDQDVEVIAK